MDCIATNISFAKHSAHVRISKIKLKLSFNSTCLFMDAFRGVKVVLEKTIWILSSHTVKGKTYSFRLNLRASSRMLWKKFEHQPQSLY